MLAVALIGLLLCQDPTPQSDTGQNKQSKSSQTSSSKKLETWPVKLARQKVKEFQKALKPKKVSMVERKRALDGLVGGISEQLIKPLQQFVEKDSSVVLRKQAVEMLADQPKDRARTVILKLLKNARVTANPQVHAGLIRGLNKVGYSRKEYKVIAEVLESDYDTERVPVHEAILDLVKDHAEQQAIPMLLRNIGEPNAADVNSAENPPAEYWKARWHSWSVWKGKVKDALFAITGQRFSTAKEAKSWLAKNKGKLK
jgi:hypothetical protein